MRHVAARGASVILAVLLGAAGVVACSGANDTEDQTQAGADSSESGSGGGDGDNNGGGSGGGDGDNNGGAPGVPGGGSGGGAPGAPINIPAISDLGGLPVDEATEVMKTKIRNECGGDLCLVVEVKVEADGEQCTYRGEPPEGTPVDRGSTFVLIASESCDRDGESEPDTGTDTDTETNGEGEPDTGTDTDTVPNGDGGTDTGTDTDTETDSGGEAETQSTP